VVGGDDLRSGEMEYGCIWVNGWMDRWIVVWMGGLMDVWTGGWMGGWMDEGLFWMGEWMDKWMVSIANF